MQILVLNGSPRPNGNTQQMIAAFREGAESVGHKVNVIDVCKKRLQVVWLVNIAIQKETAPAYRKTICRKSIYRLKKQRCL